MTEPEGRCGDAEEVRLTISIGPTPSDINRFASMIFVLVAMTFIPVVNEVFLSGHWAVHLIGGVVGLLLVAAVAALLSKKIKSFPTKEAAADWVLSEEWRPDPPEKEGK